MKPASATPSRTELEPLYSIPGAATYLNLSPHTIDAWLRDGKLRRTKVGRRTMIRESQLLRVIRDEDRPLAAATGAEGTKEAA